MNPFQRFLICSRLSIILIYLFRYLWSSCFNRVQEILSQSTNNFDLVCSSISQCLMRHFTQCSGFCRSFPWQPGHCSFSPRCPIQITQFIPHGAIRNACIEDVIFMNLLLMSTTATSSFITRCILSRNVSILFLVLPNSTDHREAQYVSHPGCLCLTFNQAKPNFPALAENGDSNNCPFYFVHCSTASIRIFAIIRQTLIAHESRSLRFS